MTARELLFWAYAAMASGGALAVVLTQNVVRMAFWLILSLGATAGLYFLLQADFIGTAQLLIYVGGTLVLLIFGVMLTASGPYLRMETSAAESLMGAILGSVLLMIIVYAPCSVNWDSVVPPSQAPHSLGFNAAEEGNSTRPLGLSLLGARPDISQKYKASFLPPGYLLPFEIVSVHLLVVLVGAAYLARAKRRKANPAELAESGEGPA